MSLGRTKFRQSLLKNSEAPGRYLHTRGQFLGGAGESTLFAPLQGTYINAGQVISNNPPIWTTVLPNILFEATAATQFFPPSGTYQSNGYVFDPDGDQVALAKNTVFVQGVAWDGGKFTYDGTGSDVSIGGHILTANDGHGHLVPSSTFTIQIGAFSWSAIEDIILLQGGSYDLNDDLINNTGQTPIFSYESGPGLPSGVTLELTGVLNATTAAVVGLTQGHVFKALTPSGIGPVWSGSATLTFTIGEAFTYEMQDFVSDPDSQTLVISRISSNPLLIGLGITWNETTDELSYNGGTVTEQTLSGSLVLRASDGTNIADRAFSVALVDATAQQYIPPDVFYPHEDSAHIDWVDISRLSWINRGGDYADRLVVSNATGGSPSATYGQTAITDTDTEKPTIWSGAEFTQLIQEWVDGTNPNWGMLLKNVSGSGTISWRSKENTAGSAIPRLTVTTSTSTSVLDVVSDTYLITGASNQGAATLIRSSNSMTTLLYFDLSTFAVGSVISASLEMQTFAQAGAATVGVFRVDLSQHQLPIPYEVGIANNYTLDAGLGSHPDVVFFHDLLDLIPGDTAANNTKWLAAGWNDGPFDDSSQYVIDRRQIVAASDPDPGTPPSNYVPLYQGSKAIRSSIVPPDGHFEIGEWFFYKNLGGIWETYNAARGNPGHPYEPEEIYFRFYFFVGDNWDIIAQGGKFTGLWSPYNTQIPASYKKPGYPIQAGNSGDLSFTCSGWSERNRAFTHRAGHVLYDAGYRAFGRLYENWMSVAEGQNSGQDAFWSRGALGYLEKGTWNSLEIRIKMNSIDTSGATKANVGYPFGSLHYGLVDNEQPSGDFQPERTNTCAATGTSNTICLDAGASASALAWVNRAVWINSRPTEIRRVLSSNGATPPVLTIGSFDGGAATWDNIPQSGEQFTLQRNVIIRERTTIPYGNNSGYIYGDPSHTPISLGGDTDTAILVSAGVGRQDGILQQWVNGRLAYSANNLWWRSLPELQIQAVVSRGFLGGDPANPGPVPYRHDCYYTHFVAAKSYIGPMRFT